MARRPPFDRPGFEPFEGGFAEIFRSGEVTIGRPPRRFWFGLGLFGLALAILVLSNPVIYVITESQWFSALGYGDVFATRLRLQALLFLASFVFALVFSAINVMAAIRRRTGGPLRAVGIRRRSLFGNLTGVAGMVACALLALVLSAGVTSRWQELALYLNSGAPGTSSGVTEPVLGQDTAFYLLQLPFLHDVVSWLIALVLLTALFTAFAHTWKGDTFDFNLDRFALAHFSILGALLAVVLAANAGLGRYDLLSAHTGVVFGPGYADVNARLPIASGRVVLDLLIAAGLLANVALRVRWLPAVAIGAWLLGVLVSAAYPAFVQGVIVKPSELQRESPYIQREIDFTRRAYALDLVKPSSYQGDAPLTRPAVTEDAATIANLRLWDYRQLLATYGQLQTIRTYYEFNDVDVDRYTIDGKLQQVELSARELATSRLPAQAQTWVNQRLNYTHGYSIAASPVSAVDPAGLPTYVTRDLPPTGPLKVDRPQIYFGELTQDWVVAPSASREFDYPGPDGNVSTTYSGTRGVSLAGGNRALWALRLGDFNLLASPQVQPRSQVLFRRNIHDRVQAVAPFLTLDHDPYMVVAGGRLYWIQDAYTTASTYPYAQSAGDINYIRNSVKAVVDPYDGSIDLYAFDEKDPIINAYRGQFPSLFKPRSSIPAELVGHLRVPEDVFNYQATIYAAYHISDPAVLFSREDVWDLPLEQNGPNTAPSQLQPYYVLMRLPGEANPEFLLIQPFTPKSKTNMVAWLAARMDPPHYGEFVAFELPRDRTILGPQQVAANINAYPPVSRDQTLLNQQGSQFLLGNLLVVPIGNTFLYFQPVYLRSSQGSSYPELKSVILAIGDQVAYAPTVDEALNQLLGGGSGTGGGTSGGGTTTPGGASQTVSQLVQQALDHYNAAQAALRNGDLATYGKEMQTVGQLLQQIQQAQAGGVLPSPAPSGSGRPPVSPAPRTSPTR